MAFWKAGSNREHGGRASGAVQQPDSLSGPHQVMLPCGTCAWRSGYGVRGLVLPAGNRQLTLPPTRLRVPFALVVPSQRRCGFYLYLKPSARCRNPLSAVLASSVSAHGWPPAQSRWCCFPNLRYNFQMPTLSAHPRPEEPPTEGSLITL